MIALAQVVLRELDDKKNFGRTPRIQDRARKATQLVERAVRGEQPDGFPSKVGLRYVEEPGFFDYDGANLSQEVRDDRLVATMMAYRDENPDRSVALVSGDSTPRINAHTRGMKSTDLPAKYRLDAESPVEKKLREVREQKRELEAGAPDPTIIVLNGPEATMIDATIKPPEPVPDAEIEDQIGDLEDRFHDLAGGRARTDQSSMDALALGGLIPDHELERFRREFDEYVQAYKKFLRSTHDYEQFLKRSTQVDLGVHNSGTVPAEDLDIEIHIPDDVEVWTEEEIPPTPTEPEPPEKPRTIQESLRHTFTFPGRDLASIVTGPSRTVIQSDPSISGWDIRDSESVEIAAWLSQVKQATMKELPTFRLVFPPGLELTSFSIDTSLRVANVPGEVSGEIHVRVNGS